VNKMNNSKNFVLGLKVPRHEDVRGGGGEDALLTSALNRGE
jgi:hypothetical protein